MERIWRFQQQLIRLGALVLCMWVVIHYGLAFGTYFEGILKSIPRFLYGLPSLIWSVVVWLAKVIWSAITDPIHAFCLIAGIAFAAALLLGLSGFFDERKHVSRGSRIVKSDDIRRRSPLSKQSLSSLASALRGSRLTDRSSLASSSNDSWTSWNKLKWKIKNFFRRP